MDTIRGPNETAQIRNYTIKFQEHGRKLGQACDPKQHEIIKKEQGAVNAMINNISTGDDEEAQIIRVKLRQVMKLTETNPGYCTFNPFWYHNDTECDCASGNSTCVLASVETTKDALKLNLNTSTITTTSTQAPAVTLNITMTNKTSAIMSGANSRHGLKSLHFAVPLIILIHNSKSSVRENEY